MQEMLNVRDEQVFYLSKYEHLKTYLIVIVIIIIIIIIIIVIIIFIIIIIIIIIIIDFISQ